jgi:hypothetical protein
LQDWIYLASAFVSRWGFAVFDLALHVGLRSIPDLIMTLWVTGSGGAYISVVDFLLLRGDVCWVWDHWLGR